MFPKMIVPLFVGRSCSVQALEKATSENNKVLLVAQKNPTKETPRAADMYRVGVVSSILQVIKLQNTNNIKILVEGMERVSLTRIISVGDYLQAHVELLGSDITFTAKEEDIALYRAVREKFEEYIKMGNKISPEILLSIMQMKDIPSFCDAVSAHLTLSVEKKQELLEQVNVLSKLERLLVLIDGEIEFLRAENRIRTRMRSQIEKNQKDYYLNEQLKAIHKELGEEDAKDELKDLSKRITKTKFSEEAKQRAKSELKKLKMMNSMSSEANVLRNYLEWLVDLPWKQLSVLKKDLNEAQRILDMEHYGLEKIKERIIEYLAVNIHTKGVASPIICVIGPPGVGKTSLAKSVANATGRAFVKVSLGGLRDEAEIKGHRRTYIGASPGKIIQAMKRAKTSNPVILLDEIDKMGHDFRGDPASALLDILDPEQNKHFSDHYLEVEYDLSNVMFITTANTPNIPKPLLDRLEVMRLSGYTEEEKMQIAKQYLIAKQCAESGVSKEVTIRDEALQDIIRYYTREAGVRELGRCIAKIMRKSIKRIMLEDINSIEVDTANLKDFLGVRKFNYGEVEKYHTIGITNGLAYTEVGGDLLAVEAVVVDGKGDVKITGKLGEVMKESAQAALSYIRSHAASVGIMPQIFKERDIHVHIPEGAIPKDGPSAGIAMCTSIVSALTDVPVCREVAMTGEITLRGRVLPIGGLKEKLLAALRGGVKTVIIPSENLKDLEGMPLSVLQKLEIKGVTDMSEVLTIAMTKSLKPLD